VFDAGGMVSMVIIWSPGLVVELVQWTSLLVVRSDLQSAGRSIAAMTPYLTPFVLIGGLVVLGLLVGIGLVLLTAMRERADVGATRDEPAEGTDQDRAA
jgi:hypothetical protein